MGIDDTKGARGRRESLLFAFDEDGEGRLPSNDDAHA